MFVVRMAAGALVVWSAAAAGIVPGDARRGEQLFQSEGCVRCHSVNGQGGATAPDLAKRVDRDFTPTVMASLMWNHAPDMWAAMRKQGLPLPALTGEQSADLFAYFVSARYFEKRGDAGRGKQVFAAKHCADCHGISSANAGGGPPVVKWESLADPVALAQQMWSHGGQMKQAFEGKKLAWAQLDGQELADILVYLQNLPETRQLKENFQFAQADSGEKLFASKGCAGCHTGANALETKLRNQTLTDIAAGMWNHEAKMKSPPPALSQEEMRGILGYIWARQYFRGEGDAGRGKKVFAQKTCGSCHGQPGNPAPNLAKGKDAYSSITIVASLWQHGPRMLETMERRKTAWQRFTTQQMADLIAYLNAL